MQIFLLAVTLLTIALIFLQRYNETIKDAEVGPASFSFNEWLRHTAVEMSWNLVVFGAVCAGLNVDFIIKATEIGTDTGTEATLVGIGGAIATGTGIYKGVQLIVLPIFNKITGGTTARNKLRKKLEEVTQTQ